MKKKALSFLLVLFIGLSISTFFSQTAEAGSYYYDKASGNYVIDVNGASETGKNLNSFAGKIPGSVGNKMRNAAIKRYGSISNQSRYYFSYKNIVRPYGKYGGSSYTGRITGMKCTGRK